MICLFCEATLPHDRPQVCDCGMEHRDRPPIAGVIHVSQLLCAIDDLRAGDLDSEEFEGIVDVFWNLYDAFEQKWRPEGSTLAARLTPTLQERFFTTLTGIDKGWESGSLAMELLQNLSAESPDQRFDEAEGALLAFFQQTCAHAAAALDEFDSLKSQIQGSGAFFNLRSS